MQPHAGGSFARQLWLAVRSLIWTVLLPGMVTGYMPWRFFGLNQTGFDVTNPVDLLGLLLIAAGSVLLGTCIWEFAASGGGTLAPVDPPRQLVVRGLYRYVRNPMYLSVTTILIGEALLVRSRQFLAYFLIWFVAVNLFVLGYEEPTLRGKFGASYDRYVESVNRWLPSFRSYPPFP
jgi:protein-S-isoprenylcysteine O-methyltransferase Ste14